MIRPRHSLLLAAGLFLSLSGCDRGNGGGQAQREADEKRIAELKDLESRAAQREQEAQTAANAQEQQRLDGEKAKLDAEWQQLQAQKAAVSEDADKLQHWRDEGRRVEEQRRTLAEERERLARTQREAHEERSRQASAQKLDAFYTALDPLGDWLQVDPYGYVFRPREAGQPGWRPYTDGTWVYTDYGWTWKGNEPFAWATCHYGRWARVHRVGWVWVPGSEWAPAWVSWRRNAEYVGWAPLPPEAHSSNGFNGGVDSYYDIGPASYNFVPAQRLGEPTYRGVVVEPAQNVSIVENTTNVTNITYSRVENRTAIVNQGPDLAQINAVSARPVPRMQLRREAEAAPGRPLGAPATVVGNVLHLAAPAFVSAPRPAAAPAKVKETVKAPEVERGWGGVAPAAVETARAHQRQEAEKAERAPVRAVAAGTPVPGPVRHLVPPPVVPVAPTAATPAPVRRPPVASPAPAAAAPGPEQATPAPRPATPMPHSATPAATPAARPATPPPATPHPKAAATPLATPPTRPALTTPPPQVAATPAPVKASPAKRPPAAAPAGSPPAAPGRKGAAEEVKATPPARP